MYFTLGLTLTFGEPRDMDELISYKSHSMKDYFDIQGLQVLTFVIFRKSKMKLFGFLSLLLTVQAYQTYQTAFDLTPYIRTNPRQARKLSQVKDPLGIIPQSYAGFINVDEQVGNKIFFWFFKDVSGEPRAPLLIYVNWLPWYSSVVGVLYGSGPIRVTVNNETIGYERWTKSWVEKYPVLYIDYPYGIGFSYTESGEGYRASQEGNARDLLEFLNQFYTMFPKYLRRDLYIGGENYAAGKLLTPLAYLLHQNIQNKTSRIRLAGLFFSAPFYEPLLQAQYFLDLHYSLGLVSNCQKFEMAENVTHLEKRFQNPFNDVTISELISTILPYVGLNDDSNYHTQQGPPPQLYLLINSDHFKKIINAGHADFRNNFDPEILPRFTREIVTSATGKMATLMDNYKVLIYNGDYALLTTTPMVEAALANTPWKGKKEYLSSERKIWSVNSELAGYYTQVGRFCRVIVRKSGYEVALDQPENSLLMLDQFITNGCIRP
ncbi:serine carboxypeptidase CPVL [Biomphalaria glabrata]